MPTRAGITADDAVLEPTPALRSRISWGVVFAGAIVAVALGTMLNILGAAVGASTVDATQGATPDASTLGIGAGIWLLAANLIGLAVGGYVAARLSGSADGTDSVLHGLSVWAVGFLLASVLLGNVVSSTAGTAVRGASSLLGGIAQGAGQAVQAAAPEVDPKALVDRARTALQTGGDPARMTSDQRNAEIAQILTRRVTGGSLAQADRDRLGQLVAAEYNIQPDEAQRRVQQVEQQATQAAQEAERRARQAADAAAEGAATAAYWAFGAMLLGAVAAVIGARVGTRRPVATDRRYA